MWAFHSMHWYDHKWMNEWMFPVYEILILNSKLSNKYIWGVRRGWLCLWGGGKAASWLLYLQVWSKNFNSPLNWHLMLLVMCGGGWKLEDFSPVQYRLSLTPRTLLRHERIFTQCWSPHWSYLGQYFTIPTLLWARERMRIINKVSH